eukprot:maker-scaffold308_size214241-snap-gene-1.34 protein:Tk09056 transcript:maker-scaffold308_size214241-snap-gene-1.34-mRNA-1 annotation:"uncharacterized oxidoreductase -like"
MASLGFHTDSPYQQVQDQVHDSSDFKYTQYLSDINPKSGNEAKKRVALALFGLGRAGTIHLTNILASPRAHLKYIVEADKKKWLAYQDQFDLHHVQHVRPEMAKIVFDDPEVDATVIATPTAAHEAMVLASLAQKKAVFCEKPISEDVLGAQRCFEKAKDANRPLFCAFNRRFDPSFNNVYRQVRSGAVGHVHLIKTTSRDSPLPTLAYLKISGGIFHDCAVHDIDLVTWILGEYPIEVYSAANALIPEIKGINDYDHVAITLKFASGSLGLIDLSRYACYGYDQRLEVFGPRGMIQVKNETPIQSHHFSSDGIHGAPIYHSFPSRYKDGYQSELNNFFDVVQGIQDNSVGPEAVLAVSKIASACEASARSGKPVALEW